MKAERQNSKRSVLDLTMHDVFESNPWIEIMFVFEDFNVTPRWMTQHLPSVPLRTISRPQPTSVQLWFSQGNLPKMA